MTSLVSRQHFLYTVIILSDCFVSLKCYFIFIGVPQGSRTTDATHRPAGSGDRRLSLRWEGYP